MELTLTLVIGLDALDCTWPLGGDSLFLSRRETDINQCNQWGTSPLHQACRWGDMSVVSRLVTDSRIQINTRDGDGHTPIMVAVEKGHLSVVSLLAQTSGIDLQIRNNDREGLLEVARWG